MNSVRTTSSASQPTFLNTDPPFSNFKFADDYFGRNCDSLKRVLSQMRALHYKTMVIEQIKSVGFSLDDDEDLKKAGVDLKGKKLVRLSFFSSPVSTIEELKILSKDSFLGYVILKQMEHKQVNYWIVFESVTKPSRHTHNYYHSIREYTVEVAGSLFNISGNLYCQQNGVTNVCAHVALRTCLAAILPEADISYRQINESLESAGLPFRPSDKGLTNEQVRSILEVLSINFSYIPYPVGNDRPSVPYQKFLYASIESSYPALLGFSHGGESHIIPIIGHTFNEDMWVPNADTTYFTIGKDTRYVSSESWVSNYICHDDNFGSHYCVPKGYFDKDDPLLVIGLQPKEMQYNAIRAEAVTIDFLHNIAMTFPYDADNVWTRRFREAINEGGWVVLRPLYMTSSVYIKHLQMITGWSGEKMQERALSVLREQLKDDVLVVEVSLPEIFPTNNRKIGEVVFDPKRSISDTNPPIILARLISDLYMLEKDSAGEIVVSRYPTTITTHTELFAY